MMSATTVHRRPRTGVVLTVCAMLAGMPLMASGKDNGSAQSVISAVWVAAKNRDIEALRPHMSEAFVYNFGDDPSREQALEQFRKNPRLFEALARAISGRCRPETEGEVRDYVCPQHFGRSVPKSVTIGPGYRAGFSKGADGVWRMDYFVTGD